MSVLVLSRCVSVSVSFGPSVDVKQGHVAQYEGLIRSVKSSEVNEKIVKSSTPLRYTVRGVMGYGPY